MDIFSSGQVHEVIGAGGCGYILPPSPEYRLPVHHHSTNTAAMSGDRETSGGVVVNEMMGTGRIGTGEGRFRDGDGDGGGKGRHR